MTGWRIGFAVGPARAGLGAHAGQVLHRHRPVPRRAEGRRGGARPGGGARGADPGGAASAGATRRSRRCARPASRWSRPRRRCISGCRCRPELASAAFATRALEETGTVVLPGSAFGPGGRRLLPHRAHGRGGPAARGGGAPGPDARSHLGEGSLPRPPELRLPPRAALADESRSWPASRVHSLLLLRLDRGAAAGAAASPVASSSCWRLRPRGRRAVPMPYRLAARRRPGGHRARPASGRRGRRSGRAPQSVAALPLPAAGAVPARYGQRLRRRARRPASPASAPASPRGGCGCDRCRCRPKELAQRLSKGHVELVDSAVTAIVQGYLDSIASDPSARRAGAAELDDGDRGQEIRDRLEEHLHRRAQDSGGGAGAAADPRGEHGPEPGVQPPHGSAGRPAVRGAAGGESGGVQGR